MNNKNELLNRIKTESKKYMMVIALVAIWIVFALLSKGTYLSARNLTNLLKQAVFVVLLITGVIYIIVLNEMDLSVGSLAALCGGVLAILNVWKGVPLGLALLITILLGIVLGLFNGWWVAYMGVPSFIVTLAGQLVFRGVLTGLTDGITISPLNDSLSIIGRDYVPAGIGFIIAIIGVAVFAFLQWSNWNNQKKKAANSDPAWKWIVKSVAMAVITIAAVAYLNTNSGVPVSVMIVAVILVISNFVMKNTVFGRRVYAIGGNKKASMLAGVNIKITTLIVFGISGFMTSLAAIALVARLNSAAVNAATGSELDAIAACVIGGTSLSGGVGTLFGAVIGALVIASIDNGMSLLDAPSFWQTIVKGVVLLLAVWFDVSRKKKA